MMIRVKQRGNFRRLERVLKTNLRRNALNVVERHCERGIEVLSKLTPKDSGKTSESWKYRVEKKPGTIKISFYNTNEVNGYNVALLIQYGHGTRNGGYVSGVDYMNPASREIFKTMANDLWREVSGS